MLIISLNPSLQRNTKSLFLGSNNLLFSYVFIVQYQSKSISVIINKGLDVLFLFYFLIMKVKTFTDLDQF